jgi:hypothetical protein
MRREAGKIAVCGPPRRIDFAIACNEYTRIGTGSIIICEEARLARRFETSRQCA